MTNGHNPTNGDSPPSIMSPEQFAIYMEKRLTLHEDDIQLINRNGLTLHLRVQGRTVEVDLANFHAAYAQNPTQLDAVARTFVRVLLGELPPQTESDYTSLADRIYPMLKRIDLLAEVRERNLPMLAYREFLADLIVTYVIDEQRSVAYVNDNHLEHWGVSLHELHEQALENLRTRTHQQVDYVATGVDEQRLFIFNSGDGYDATRLLLTEILSSWAEEVPGNLVIGLPNRDFLIGFSDADGDILRSVAAQIQVDAAQQAYSITEQLFTLEDGQIREYEWE